MEQIKLLLPVNCRGAFVIEEGDQRMAAMEIGIKGSSLTVYHTEVSEKLKGKGIASQLLSEMATYAREHQLKVIALCPYVSAQFKKHPDLYDDIWNRSWHSDS